MPKTAKEARIEEQEGIGVHRMPAGISGVHSDYGLWIFSYGREVRHSPRSQIRPRRFEFYGISHLLEGRGWLWSSGTDGVRRFGPGAAVMSMPGTLQDYGGDGTEYVEDSICFAGPVADSLFKSGVIGDGLAEFGAARRLAPVFEAVQSPSKDAQIKANMLLQRLLVETYLESRERAHGVQPPLAGLLSMLPSEPGRWWPVREMAEICLLSESQFRRVFIRETGLHPKEYVDKWKMGHAASLLLSGGAGVKEAAKRVGYGDPYHFSRRFKQLMGMPPEQYRERMSLPGVPVKGQPL